jgi:hypothetical protein
MKGIVAGIASLAFVFLAGCVGQMPARPAAVAEPDTAGLPLMAEREAPAVLGTRWGEDLASRVSFVDLVRVRPTDPDGRAVIRYNDADGVEASVGRAGEILRRVDLADERIEMSVEDSRGRPMNIRRASGNGRLYLAGREGQRYRLVFDNEGDRPFEIVATVDGLDVISGRPGSIANRGYVVYPGGTLTIDGFRRSDSEVAAFRFSAPGESYAAEGAYGDIRNVGVIGVAAFVLRERRPPPDLIAQDDTVAQPFPADDSRYAPPP